MGSHYDGSDDFYKTDLKGFLKSSKYLTKPWFLMLE